jgi:hypothetical protein
MGICAERIDPGEGASGRADGGALEAVQRRVTASPFSAHLSIS